MLMKLALRNVRRSMRDYAVYFVTLTLGVAVFYAFNAIEDSRVLFEAQEGAANVFLSSGASIFDILSQVMTYFSVVVAVVLGFLVLYANRFVVRARKKEFGTYLLLGMSPRQSPPIWIYSEGKSSMTSVRTFSRNSNVFSFPIQKSDCL